MSKLRKFLEENSDIIWPALCLFFCVLAILFAALKSITAVAVNESPGASVNVIKGNRVLEINRD